MHLIAGVGGCNHLAVGISFRIVVLGNFNNYVLPVPYIHNVIFHIDVVVFGVRSNNCDFHITAVGFRLDTDGILGVICKNKIYASPKNGSVHAGFHIRGNILVTGPVHNFQVGQQRTVVQH